MPTPSPQHLLERAGSLAADWWPTIVTALGAITLALPELAGNDGTVPIPAHPSDGTVFAIGAVLTAIGLLRSAARQQKVTRLRADAEQASIELARSRRALEELGRVELSLLGEELKYLSPERLSLLCCTGDRFELVARYSANPSYVVAGSRSYKLTDGCHGRAWEQGSAELVVPVARNADRQAWVASHVDSGLPLVVADDLRMPTRTVIAVRIDDPRAARRPLGVVVLESEQAHTDIVVGGGPPSALLEPALVRTRLGTYNRRLAGVLSVFTELRGSSS